MLARLERFAQRTARIPYSPYLLIVVPTLVGFVRLGLEALLGHPVRAVDHAFNFVLFYLLLQVLLTAVVSAASSRPRHQVAGAVALGTVVAWLPPVLELLLFSQPGRTYRFALSFQWSLAMPGQPVWETVGAWLGLALVAGFVGLLTRRTTRALMALAGGYGVLQIVGWLIPVAAERLAQWPDLRSAAGVVTIYNLAAIVLSLGVYLVWNRGTLLPSLQRLTHALPCGLVTALGARMAGQPVGLAVVKGLVMAVGALLVIITNDYHDRSQDAVAGAARPVSPDDLVIATFFEVLLTLWVGLLDPAAMFLVALFFALAFAYHHPALRLKRLFCAAYKIEGLAAAACFLFGAGSRALPQPWIRPVTLLVFGGFALGSMLKDYKDIQQDRADAVGTIYTRQLAKGRSLGIIHAGVSLAISLGLLVPPALLAVYTAAPIWLWAPLAALAPVMALLLLRTRRPKACVERGLLLLSVYLAGLVVAAPRLGW